MNRKEDFQEKGKNKNKICSPMSNSAWCDFKNKSIGLKLRDMSPKPKSKCQKQINFNPNQFQFEGAGL